MGLSFSEEVDENPRIEAENQLIEEKNKRIRELEAENLYLIEAENMRIRDLEAENKRLKDSKAPQSFDFGPIVLTDSSKLFSIQISERYNDSFDNETDNLNTDEDLEKYMKSRGLTTEEELNAYAESQKEYDFCITVSSNVYPGANETFVRRFKNAEEFKEFKKRFVEWAGPKYASI